jgi:hypothetical protein
MGESGGAALPCTRSIGMSSRLILHVHQPPQLVTSPGQTRAHSADRHAEDRGDLVVTHPFEADEQDHLALFLRQLADRPFEIAQLQCGDRVGLDRQYRRYLFHRDTDPFAGRTPDVVDILVVQDREEPGPQIGAGLPENARALTRDLNALICLHQGAPPPPL